MIKGIVRTTIFEKELKRYGLSVELIKVLNYLIERQALPQKYNNHRLQGKYSDFYDCHVKPDLILIYRYKDDYLELARLGTHSELFKC
ncbi:type II toxin-antitoxin system YafQ family toxin [Helicobacter cetorum]|uniref:Addiction module toxin, RelE/StbE family protein n=1 Tax=Helicobacter cetorum (strain ATCC BAA-540 / CCUG 52418 / MIT 99-5656) TaxID=1163745 RepID=I0ESC2_HELCM|nr:type II toxin-antitoxin system YafQ family toxin [Helicobacter cetorum]AFI05841.1 hypothetical protein HCD_04135 [Helicobacter cetorum MIT 99-5656]